MTFARMFTDSFVLSPISTRLLLKSLLAIHRNSEILTFSRIRHAGSDPDSLAKVELNISSVDSAGYTILSFSFPNEFFQSIEASELLIAGLATPTIANTKQVVRMFRGVSPNRIVCAHLRINVESVQIEFFWKNGLVSSRTVSAVTPSEGSSLPPDSLPDPTILPPIRLASFAPKFFHSLLNLIPESPLLWTLTVHHALGDNGASQLCLTNSASSVSLYQAELNRNGSYFSHSECMSYIFLTPIYIIVRLNESFTAPLAELKHLAAIAADEVLKDSFTLVFGFEDFNAEPVLVIRAAPIANQNCVFYVSMWYRACNPPIRDPGETFTPAPNSPQDLLFDDDNDDDLLLAAETMEQQQLPFIESTCTQQSRHCDQTVLQETQFGIIPEWDTEIPSTPTNDPAAMALFLEELWE